MLTLTWQVNGEDRSVEFDAVISEEHGGAVAVTEHPVEKGANIADHARPEQEKLTFEALVTNTPLRLPATQNKSATERQATRELVGTRRIRGVPVPYAEAVGVLDFSAEMDRPKDVWTELRDVKDNARLLTIDIGNMRTYSDMLIDNLTVPRAAGDKGDKLKFTVSCRKIQIVESRTSTGGPQKKKRDDKGHQGTTAVDEDKPLASTLHNLLGGS